jgi:replication-associated recombination protein RarA
MNWTIIIEVLVVIGVALAFLGSVWYLMTHNPNYEPREILRNPWKIFDLIDHAKENVTHNLKKIKEETQQALDTTKAVKEEVKAIVKQMQDTTTEVKNDIKELSDKK